MVPHLREVDKWTAQAFDNFIAEAQNTGNKIRLHEIAIKPEGRQETVIESMFLDSIMLQIPDVFAVSSQTSRSYGDRRYKHDILACYKQKPIMVVEVKSPFTNHDGIRFHTGKNRSLTKDSKALRAALQDGVIGAYELITLYECYAVDSKGEVIILENAIKRNEDAIKSRYKIYWPTRKDYRFRRGEEEVDKAMERIADELEMRPERIRGWTRIELSGANSNTRAFLDCALFRMRGI